MEIDSGFARMKMRVNTPLARNCGSILTLFTLGVVAAIASPAISDLRSARQTQQPYGQTAIPGETAGQEPDPTAPGSDTAAQQELDRTHEGEIRHAQDLAAAWLTLLDQGKYKQAWQQFAVITRQRVSEKDWEYQVKRTKENYGRFISRHPTETHYATDLPNAPPGRYVVAQYQAHFEHKPQANETVVVSQSREGVWQVAGYFLQ
jgi:hypothetical protein